MENHRLVHCGQPRAPLPRAQYTELVSGRMSLSVRWAGWTLLAVLIGLAVAMLLEERGPLERRVLARVPEGAAIVGYAELDALRQSNLLGRLVRERLVDSAGLAMVESERIRRAAPGHDECEVGL